MKYFVVFYESADGLEARVPPAFPAHRRWVEQFVERGDLLMVGVFGDPQSQGSMSVFADEAAAREFAEGDPFVLEGVVRRYEIREWHDILTSGVVALPSPAWSSP